MLEKAQPVCFSRYHWSELPSNALLIVSGYRTGEKKSHSRLTALGLFKVKHGKSKIGS